MTVVDIETLRRAYDERDEARLQQQYEREQGAQARKERDAALKREGKALREALEARAERDAAVARAEAAELTAEDMRNQAAEAQRKCAALDAQVDRLSANWASEHEHRKSDFARASRAEAEAKRLRVALDAVVLRAEDARDESGECDDDGDAAEAATEGLATVRRVALEALGVKP